MIPDVLVNDLFENCYGEFGEVERDASGEIIYRLPPLDEIWLSE